MQWNSVNACDLLLIENQLFIHVFIFNVAHRLTVFSLFFFCVPANIKHDASDFPPMSYVS